jgi:hypothetical protein
MPAVGESLPRCSLPSDACGLDDLALDLVLTTEDRAPLRLESGWSTAWTVRFTGSAGERSCPVAEFPGGMRGLGSVRRFGWSRRQRHRPGLQFMVCTGRHHGFESLAEQRLLMVLDFLGVEDVVSQPLGLRMSTAEGWAGHVPDFLVQGAGGPWLIDVRPAELVKAPDRVRFAGAAEAALAWGWRYLVVTGWRANVVGMIDALSAQRRGLADPFGVVPRLLAAVERGPVRFAELVASTGLPVIARAQALHLIWRRRLVVDLARPLRADSLVWSVSCRGRSS